MQTTKDAYGVLLEKLTEIEAALTDVYQRRNERLGIFTIKKLVEEAKQTLKANFYVTGDDEPPVA
ncbi:hypothetical protein [Treponema pedis]|uniref:hypothetical protein n=1 Tax=Treponema pedis TaxID=409322 RepID=UPI003D253533